MQVMISFFKMFFSKEKIKFERTIKDLKPKYLESLINIENTLKEGKIYAQANYVEKTIESLRNENYADFEKEIKSVNFWGGSGAIWEVHFENRELQKKFNFEMIELINLMEKAKLSNSRIKPLLKLFKKEI